MSITRLLENKNVIAEFSNSFTKPSLKVQKNVQAHPLTKDYSIVGTAFDILLKLHIELFNPNAILSNHYEFEKVLILLNNNQYKHYKKIIEYFKKDINEFFKKKKVSENLIISSLQLAYLDIVYKTGRLKYFPDDLKRASKKNIEDIFNLCTLIDKTIWSDKKRCLLSQDFDKASRLFGGAEADLILDNAIIDIKTTKNPRFEKKFFYQLISYYILYYLIGLDESEKYPITSLGIYFSRTGQLSLFSISEIVKEQKSQDFISFFIQEALKNNPVQNFPLSKFQLNIF